MSYEAFDYRQKQLDAVKTVEDILEAIDDEHYVTRAHIAYLDEAHVGIIIHLPHDAHAKGVARYLFSTKYGETDHGFAIHRSGTIDSAHGVFGVTISSEQPKAKKIAELEERLAELRGDVA